MSQELSKKDLNRKAAIAGIFYVFMQFFVRGITFIMTPIYSRMVSTAQYGEIRVYESWLLIFVPIMSLCLYRSEDKAKFDYREEFDRYLSSIQTLSYLMITCCFGIITLFFRKSFMRFCGIDSFLYIYMILYVFAYSSILYYQKRERQMLRYRTGTFFTAVTMIPATILSIVLLYLGNITGNKEALVQLRVAGFYTPQIIGGLIVAYTMWKQGNFCVKKKYWKYALAYSIPLIPEMLSIQLMNQSDKIMIQRMVGSESAGIFAMATTISFIIWIIEDAVWGAWLPWLYEKISRNETQEIEKPWYLIVKIFGFISWGLVILSPEIILLLGGSKYKVAMYLVAPMVTGMLLRFFSNCFTAMENYNKKTIYTATGTVIAMIINLILNYVFIRLIGYQAAAYTTAFSYLLLLIIQGIFEKKTCGLNCISLKKMLAYSSAFATVNIATNAVLGFPWYIRWGIALFFGVIVLITIYPQLKKFLKQLEKGDKKC